MDPPAAQLVDLVEVDDPPLGSLHVHAGGEEQLVEDALHVLADVARLGQRRGIGDGERHAQELGQGRARWVLPEPLGPISRTLRLLDRDVPQGGVGDDRGVGGPVHGVQEPDEVVRDGDGQGPLGPVLADDGAVQVLDDLSGGGKEALLPLSRVRYGLHGERHLRGCTDRRPKRATDDVPDGVRTVLVEPGGWTRMSRGTRHWPPPSDIPPVPRVETRTPPGQGGVLVGWGSTAGSNDAMLDLPPQLER